MFARDGRLRARKAVLTLSLDGKFAYVPMRGEAKVAVVQLDPLRLLKKLDAPNGPHDGNTAVDGTVYIGAQFGNNVIVIDPKTQNVSHLIPTVDGVRPVRPSPDGKTLYVALSNLLGFVTIDVDARKVTRRVELGTLPEGIPVPYRDTWTHDLMVSPDGKIIFASLWFSDAVAAVDVATKKVVKNIQFPLGTGPKRIAIAPRP